MRLIDIRGKRDRVRFRKTDEGFGMVMDVSGLE
ncbi:hypothetical protein E2C01_092974 [Portunus trituberculatus]|uniref:Uncharacterized protein n=1 Tax=Portunus trituberculatus TaxID=210409 RepID=A0A5B7JLQ0_PORTR|nr:hypothetical protein [Portunus trituberculatus]